MIGYLESLNVNQRVFKLILPVYYKNLPPLIAAVVVKKKEKKKKEREKEKVVSLLRLLLPPWALNGWYSSGVEVPPSLLLLLYPFYLEPP